MVLLSTFLFVHDMLELNAFYLVLVSLAIKYPLPISSTKYQQQCVHNITKYNPLWDLRHYWHSPVSQCGYIYGRTVVVQLFCCGCPVLQDLAIMGMRLAILGEKTVLMVVLVQSW